MQALPPLRLGYSAFDPSRRDLTRIDGGDPPSISVADAGCELVDLTGDGLPDVLQLDGVARYWRNLGDSRFDLPRTMPQPPAGMGLADPGVQLLDVDGNGRADLFVVNDRVAGYFPLSFEPRRDESSFHPLRTAPSFDLKGPDVRLADLNGDGLTDILRPGSRLDYFFNDEMDGWSDTRSLAEPPLDAFPAGLGDQRTHWVDMTGDGLVDVAFVHDGSVEYWPSLGWGDWGPPVAMKHSPRLPFGYDPRRVLVGDVDGDGLADLVYVDDTKVTLWLNCAGNEWSTPLVIDGTPPISDLDAVRLVDLNGTGVAGLLWALDTGHPLRRSMYFLDFTGGAKPYLLNEVDNGIGATTRIGYAPSTRFYLEDQQRPATRWRTPLPFPVQVVAQVEVLDAISGGKLTTGYRYAHGYWDGLEREFRGFGRVGVRDTEVFGDYHGRGLGGDTSFAPVTARAFCPPVETRTWFHLGPVGGLDDWRELDYGSEFWRGDLPGLPRPEATAELLRSLQPADRRDAVRTLRGTILRTEVYGLDGSSREDRPYTVTEHVHGIRQELNGSAADGPPVFFPHLDAQRTTQWDCGDDPMTQVSFHSEYDGYGQACLDLAVAVPRLRDWRVRAGPGTPYLSTCTKTVYAKPAAGVTRLLVDRVARTTSYEVPNDGSPSVAALRDDVEAGRIARRVTGHTRHLHDGAAFTGLAEGLVGEHGAHVRSETLALTNDFLGASRPPYLDPAGPPIWTDEYPAAFRTGAPPLAGYLHRNEGELTGLYAVTDRRRYDFQTRGRSTRARPRHPRPHGPGDPLRLCRRVRPAADHGERRRRPHDLRGL